MQAAQNPRGLVLETLLSITKDGAYSHQVLKQVLDKYQYLDKKERAFITRVVDGVLEHRIEIDAIIDQFSKVKIANMKPVIATLLRSAVYELKYMDGSPAYAVINETVNLARKKGFGSLAGFVNGVLRSISRSLRAPEDKKAGAPDGTDEARTLSLKYSLPLWIVEQWLTVYQADTVAKMGADFLKEKPTTIRFDEHRISKKDLTEKLKAQGVTVEDPKTLAEDAGEPSGDIPSCALCISGYDHLEGLAAFLDGDFQVQDVSAMQAVLWADPKPGDYVLDVCAAPGGKALFAAELLNGTGLVEARDLSKKKVALLNEAIARSGLTNIRARKMDAAAPDPASVGKADIVLADLPCSGLGTLGRKRDLKYRMTPEQELELADLQRQILTVIQAYVRPGGKLMYSTCTIDQAENDQNVRWFLDGFPAFHLVKEEQRLPGVTFGDGFYLALLVKDEERDG